METPDAQKIATQLADARKKIEDQIARRVVGQRSVIDLLLVTLL